MLIGVVIKRVRWVAEDFPVSRWAVSFSSLGMTAVGDISRKCGLAIELVTGYLLHLSPVVTN